VTPRKADKQTIAIQRNPSDMVERIVLDEIAFQRMIALERKRADRSQKHFLLMLVDFGHALTLKHTNGHGLQELISAISLMTRETDIVGWYTENRAIGVMFTEINVEDRETIHATMMTRLSEVLRSHQSRKDFNHVTISFHLYPEDWDKEAEDRTSNPVLYPDLVQRDKERRLTRTLKRVIDIVGSVGALVFFAPLLAVIAVAVKLTSKGPVIFRQKRLGQFGKAFEFLKFRSMYTNNDFTIHKTFIKEVIKGNYEGNVEDSASPVYKMTDDPRITPLGRFLRRTSLDELPQFINILKGDMSLVGPRPPLAYEYQEYAIWHRGRVLAAKPGLTGLWQIRGRSRVRFDDMVRLDLQYVRTWSLWLDLQILMRTPGAVLFNRDSF
jgi:lipopolysaccharide/colanic/teichoic acid biosynthesis glycosyltransferase